MKHTTLHSALLAACFSCAGPALAAVIDLETTPIDLSGVGYVTYGNFNSYSLPFAQLGCNGVKACEDALTIQGQPGQIANLVVIADGNSEINFPGMDNALNTTTGTDTFFSGQWKSTVSALENFLTLGSTVHSPVIFFRNNQNNGEEQSLAVWGRVWISDPAKNPYGDSYYLTNDNGKYALVTEGGGGIFGGDPYAYSGGEILPDAGSNADTDYVLAGGQLCANEVLGQIVPVSCALPHSIGPINHNLGNYGNYAEISEPLNDALALLFADASKDNYLVNFDVRLGCDPRFGAPDAVICTGLDSGDPTAPTFWGKNLTDGSEAIFIGRGAELPVPPPPPPPPPPGVPEPATLALLGLGLTGLSLGRRRKS